MNETKNRIIEINAPGNTRPPLKLIMELSDKRGTVVACFLEWRARADRADRALLGWLRAHPEKGDGGEWHMEWASTIVFGKFLKEDDRPLDTQALRNPETQHFKTFGDGVKVIKARLQNALELKIAQTEESQEKERMRTENMGRLTGQSLAFFNEEA